MQYRNLKIILPSVAVLVVAAIVLIYFFSPQPKISAPLKSALKSLDDVATIEVPNSPRVQSNTPDPNILAHYYLLYDAKTGYPIVQKNSDQPVPIASTTKIMTAIIVLEKYHLNDMITVDPASTDVAGSKIMLKPGEQMTVEELLKGLLIRSGNDAAYVLAKQMGTVENFVAAMNQKADYLGLRNTRFYDPAGLDDNGYSTAQGLAVMMRYALKFPKFVEIIQTPQTVLQAADGDISHELENSNRLVTEEMHFEGIIGGKTGYTPTAGHILITAAQRNGHCLIATIVNTFENTGDASAKEAEKLLSWGFDNVIF